MNQPKGKHLKRYPVHPWAVSTGTDGKTVRYSAVVYRRNMGTEDSQNVFNVKKATRIEISKRRHAQLGKAPTANWPPMPKPGSHVHIQVVKSLNANSWYQTTLRSAQQMET